MLQNLLTKHRHFYKLILKQGSFKFQIYVLFETYPISIYKHYRLQGFLRMNIKWKTFENTRALALINKNTKMQTKWFAHYHFKWETLFSDSLSINPIPLLFKKNLEHLVGAILAWVNYFMNIRNFMATLTLKSYCLFHSEQGNRVLNC